MLTKTHSKHYKKPIAILIAFILSSCNDPAPPDLLSYLLMGSQGGDIGIAVSDLRGTGRFITMSPEGVLRFGQREIHSDASLRYHEGNVYVLNRLGRDSLQILDRNLMYNTKAEFSTGLGSNPHDIAIANSEKAYISRYEQSDLLVIQPLTGQTVNLIQLLPFADNDGIPEMSSLFIDNTSLYVALQRLNRYSTDGIFQPTEYSSLVEIDIEQDSVKTEYIMPASNPFGKWQKVYLFDAPHMVIAAPSGVGVNTDLRGGVIAFNLFTKSFYNGFLYSEAGAGGDILDVKIKNDRTGYAIVSFADNTCEIHRFDPSTGQQTSVVDFFSSRDGYLSSLLMGPNGILYVGVADYENPGILMYDTEQNDRKIQSAPVDTDLRPMDLIFIY